MHVKILPMGEHALLVEVGEGAEEAGRAERSAARVLALAEAVRRRSRAPADGWRDAVVEVVPAARTLLLRVRDPAALPRVEEGMSALAATVEADPEGVRSGGDPVILPVTYDGPDLAEVAGLTGLDEEEVIRRHTKATWRVAFIGFAPGFAYLVGDDRSLEVPRRDTPRTAVPPGSVGLAGEFSGIYPRRSPGGWQLIGRTDAVLWDVDRDPPALLAPGTAVRFEEAR